MGQYLSHNPMTSHIALLSISSSMSLTIYIRQKPRNIYKYCDPLRTRFFVGPDWKVVLDLKKACLLLIAMVGHSSNLARV